ncbi:tyrosine-type recombinase/integrase [Hoeflea sp. AS16]|uniref:tyrosine-type recombinase/integrase n=1 Tax=Hoeflea sp. AS16 TaxID=3135779 RepID=UPI00316D96E9
MLTDAAARKLEPGSKPRQDGTVKGLQLIPSRTKGQGKWNLRFVSPVTGKRRDMGLGSYPEVSIAAARRAAWEARDVIAAGGDPLEAKRAAEMERRLETSMPSFEQAARQAFAELRPGFKNAKHTQQWIGTLETYVFPKLGGRPVNELRASDFSDALRPIWLSKPETASRIRQRCDSVMNWCVAQDYIVASPVQNVDRLLPKQKGKRERVQHHPAVPWRDISAFAERVLRTGKPTIGKLALEFLILTAARSGEVRLMEWSEIDWDVAIWTIPKDRMKTGVAHRVPLSPRAIEILSTRQPEEEFSPFVFPSRNGSPLSDMALTKALRDAQVQSDTPGRIATAHGFRSSFRDWASENGYPRDIAERALAHTIASATEAAYHRTDLLDQRRELMAAWGRLLQR